MIDRGAALLKIGIEGIGIIREGRYGNIPLPRVIQNVRGVDVVCKDALRVDMAHTRIAALRLARGPARHFDAFKAHIRSDIHRFFIRPAIQNGGQKSEFKHAPISLHLSAISNFRGFQSCGLPRRSEWTQTPRAWRSARSRRKWRARYRAQGNPSTDR